MCLATDSLSFKLFLLENGKERKSGFKINIILYDLCHECKTNSVLTAPL